MQVSYFLLIPTGESRGLLFSQIIVICKQFNDKKNLCECLWCNCTKLLPFVPDLVDVIQSEVWKTLLVVIR